MGLEWLQSVGMHHIRNHTSSLIAWLTTELKSLRWDNGKPFCFIPEIEDGEVGSTVSMLVLSREGKIVPHRVMEKKMVNANFAVRTGCFCNPGSGFHMLRWYDASLVTGDMLVSNFNSNWDAFANVYRTLGLVRVSVGIPTTFDECYHFLRFLQTELLSRPSELVEEMQHFSATAKTPYLFC